MEKNKAEFRDQECLSWDILDRIIRKSSLARQLLSRDLNGVREKIMRLSGENVCRQSEGYHCCVLQLRIHKLRHLEYFLSSPSGL